MLAVTFFALSFLAAEAIFAQATTATVHGHHSAAIAALSAA
jgi:hypothetical protein